MRLRLSPSLGLRRANGSSVVLTWMRSILQKHKSGLRRQSQTYGWINTASEVCVCEATAELTVWSYYTQFIWASPEESMSKCVSVWLNLVSRWVTGGERGCTLLLSDRSTPVRQRNVWSPAMRAVVPRHLATPGTTHSHIMHTYLQSSEVQLLCKRPEQRKTCPTFTAHFNKDL